MLIGDDITRRVWSGVLAQLTPCDAKGSTRYESYNDRAHGA